MKKILNNTCSILTEIVHITTYLYVIGLCGFYITVFFFFFPQEGKLFNGFVSWSSWGYFGIKFNGK